MINSEDILYDRSLQLLRTLPMEARIEFGNTCGGQAEALCEEMAEKRLAFAEKYIAEHPNCKVAQDALRFFPRFGKIRNPEDSGAENFLLPVPRAKLKDAYIAQQNLRIRLYEHMLNLNPVQADVLFEETFGEMVRQALLTKSDFQCLRTLADTAPMFTQQKPEEKQPSLWEKLADFSDNSQYQRLSETELLQLINEIHAGPQEEAFLRFLHSGLHYPVIARKMGISLSAVKRLAVKVREAVKCAGSLREEN